MSPHRENTAAIFEALLRMFGMVLVFLSLIGMYANLSAARDFAAAGLTDYPDLGPTLTVVFACYGLLILFGIYCFRGGRLVMKLAFPGQALE